MLCGAFGSLWSVYRRTPDQTRGLEAPCTNVSKKVGQFPLDMEMKCQLRQLDDRSTGGDVWHDRAYRNELVSRVGFIVVWLVAPVGRFGDALHHLCDSNAFGSDSTLCERAVY